ncbi:TetR/AcrR family transcriptional regulator [Streptomyces sp. NPDC049687]|uniref:TetR/AcrR family transcriptional regulator n=1 Tax=Streptomyces sp. NPDC049687 TaxID=3365596 RepID=UPI0037B9044E
MTTTGAGVPPEDVPDTPGRTDSPPGSRPADGRRRRDAAATRQALLGAARGRFTRLGYDRTTLRDVAADAGVNLALIKRYFGSKEGLFKAALATAPRFLGGEGGFPGDPAALAEALSRQLAAGAWAEFGEHPVLMLLRDSGDEQVDDLRRHALEDFSRQVLAASGGRSAPEDEELLRAQLLVALGVGVAVLRSAVGLQPLGGATSDDLLGPLNDIVAGLLTPPPATGPGGTG